MLRIGDIHVNKKNASELVAALREYIATYPEEEHIVFVGDYVYHFQYERAALLALYQLFLDLYDQGKYLYILAGNHDWIHNYFVYEEGKRSFDVQGGQGGETKGSIYFITQPQFFTIEGQDCLFFPYTPFLEVAESNTNFLPLRESSHLGEQLSGKANALLTEMIQKWRAKNTTTAELYIFHHRYLADTKFPGQKAIFSYKQHALSPEFAKQEDLLLISGHMHQPFVWERYICVGSIWYTSPLEINQVKFLFQVNITTKKLTLTPLFINPYVRIQQKDMEHVTIDLLDTYQQNIYITCCQYLSTLPKNRSVIYEKADFPRKKTTFTIESDELSYETLDEYIPSVVSQGLQRVIIKRPRKVNQVMLQDLTIGTEQLDMSIANWKQLLEEYIHRKYQDDGDSYMELLHSLKILQ